MKNKAAQQLGKLGGQVKSEVKTKAVRENGKKGGRPKVCMPITEVQVNLRNLIDYYNVKVIKDPKQHINYEVAQAFMFGVDEK